VERPGDENPLMAEAMRIGQPQDETAQSDQPATRPVNEPNVGSFESFMSSFGAPGRWAGR